MLLNMSKKVIFFVPLFIGMIVTTGCAQLPSNPMPQAEDLPLRNPFRSGPKVKLGALPASSKAKAADMPHFKRQWDSQLSVLSYGISSYPKILPTVDSTYVYQADHKGKLVVLNRKTGNIQEVFTIPYRISAGPVITKDNILVATQDAKVASIHKKTGKVQWAAPVSSQVLAKPQSNGKTVVVHTIDGKITGLNAENGSILWTYEGVRPSLTLRGSASPYIIEEFVLSGLSSGKLVALNLESGMPVWEKMIATPKGRSDLNRMVDIRSDLIIQEGSVFVAAFQGNIMKIQLSSGEMQWQKPISVYQTMQIDDNALYVTDANHHIFALDQETGATLWEQDNLAGRYATAPIKVGNALVVGDRGGYLHILDKKTGQIQGRHFVGSKIMSDLSVEGDQIFVLTQNGKLSVFKVVK